MLSLACVFVWVFDFPSVEMWLDHGEDWCCGLSKVGQVETVGFRQVMWLVMLESAKDRVLGVDPSEQHVPPRVRYGTACWLIREALVSLSCRKCGTGIAIPMRPQGARGVWGYSVLPTARNLSNCERGLRVQWDIQEWETYDKVRQTIWG
jgi:hypothetical protein